MLVDEASDPPVVEGESSMMKRPGPEVERQAQEDRGAKDAPRGYDSALPSIRHGAVSADQSSRTYSYSKGWPLMPRAGLAIQLAILPTSYTGFCRVAT